MLQKEPTDRLIPKELLTELMKMSEVNFHEQEIPSTASSVVKASNSYKNAQCKATFVGHSGVVSCLLMLTSGELVSGSYDDTIRVWSISDGKCLGVLEGHTNKVEGIFELKSSGELVSYSDDETIRIWNVKRKECVGILEHKYTINSVIELSNGELVSAGGGNFIKVWNLKEKQCVATYNVMQYFVHSLLELNNGELAIGRFETVILWDIKTRKKVGTLERHCQSIKHMIQLKSGELVTACQHSDTTIKIWNIEKRVCLKNLECNEQISCLFQLKTGELISGHKEIIVWNVEKGENLATLEGHFCSIYQIFELNNGEVISFSDSIKIWNIKKRDCIAILNEHKSLVKFVIELKNGDLVSCSDDKTIKIWSAI